MFALATMIHGWTFSTLWTYLGVDTSLRLHDETYPPDKRLNYLLTLALINGVVVSPLVMALWGKQLRQASLKKANKDKRRKRR